MSTGPGIAITGASGRMGQMLIQTVMASDRAHLVGAIERSGHDWVGRDVGEAMGGVAIGVTVTDDALEAISKAQVVIDFTAPAATLGFAELCAQARAVHVIGTTGMSDDDIAQLDPRRTARCDCAGRQHEPRGEPVGATDKKGRGGIGRRLRY